MESLNEKITTIDNQIVTLKTEMEQLANDFIDAADQHIKRDFESRMDRILRYYPEQIQHLSTRNLLGNMKQDYENLLENVPEIVRSYLDRDDLWYHRNDKWKVRDEFRSEYELKKDGNPCYNDQPYILDDPLRNILGSFGDILIKYKFKHKEWRTDTVYTQYSGEYTWPEKMKNIVENYVQIHDKIKDLEVEQYHLKNEISQMKAATLWTQA